MCKLCLRYASAMIVFRQRRTSHECIIFVSSHLRGMIESIYATYVPRHVSRVFVEKMKSCYVMFKDLNKNEGQIFFLPSSLYVRNYCHCFRAFTFCPRRICVTKRSRVFSSRETNKRLFYSWREQRTGKTLSDCTTWYQIKTKRNAQYKVYKVKL